MTQLMLTINQFSLVKCIQVIQSLCSPKWFLLITLCRVILCSITLIQVTHHRPLLLILVWDKDLHTLFIHLVQQPTHILPRCLTQITKRLDHTACNHRELLCTLLIIL